MSQLETPALAADAPSTNSRQWLLAILLYVLAIIPFLPAIHGQYTWDDNAWLVDNAPVHAWNGLLTIWNPFAQGLHFYPVVFTALWIQHKLWALDPTGYHTVNFLLHGTSALLLWRILRRLNLRAAWLGALFWAIHPVQVDTVAWIAEQKNTLSGVFYFLAALSYLRFERIGDAASPDSPNAPGSPDAPLPRLWKFYALALFAFLLALLAKAVTCTLPAGLFLLLWWKRRRLSLKDLLPLLPLLIIGLGISGWSAGQEHHDIIVGGVDNLRFNPLQRLFIASKDVWFYFRTLLFPYPLMAVYPRWTYALTDPLNYLSLASGIGFLAALFALRRRIGFGPFIAVAFFFVTISPALGFINFYTMYYTFVADHYQYLASAGILVLLAELLLRAFSALLHVDYLGTLEALAARASALKAHVAAAVIIYLFTIGTFFYASLFQTTMKMWSWSVAHNPNAYAAQFNLAGAYASERNLAEANKHADIALKLGPNDDTVQNGYARLCMFEGRYQEALEHFRRAIQLRPSLPEHYTYLGDALLKLHRPQEAVEAYRKGVEIASDDPKCYYGYALGLLAVHKDKEALDAFKKALDLAPGNMVIRYDYANHLLDAGDTPEAIKQYRFILKYQHNSDAVWDNLAAAYFQAGQLPQARAAKDQANAIRAAAAPPPSLPASRPAPSRPATPSPPSH